MKGAFTVIELIFTIIIIALLASVSIPRFQATKDDAATATILTQLADCITYAGTYYTARGIVSLDAPDCDASKKCFDIDIKDDPHEGKIVVKSGSGVVNAKDKDKEYCKMAYKLSEKKSLALPEGKIHDVGAIRVVYDN